MSEQAKWRDIETAPRDGTKVLVAVQHSGLVWRLVARTLDGYGDWYSDPGKYHIVPTHWMPLPDAPNESNTESK